MKNNVHKKGFTLIELLVVISIIALLLSVLVPSLSLAKEKAKTVLCQNNLRNYGLAGELYLGENDDRYPDAWRSLFAKSPSGWCQWHHKAYFLDSRPDLAGPLWPYLEAAEIHLCPTFLKIGKTYGQLHPEHNPDIPVEPQYSYSMNYMLSADEGVKKRTQIRRTSQCFFFAEENMWTTSGLNSFVLNDNALVTRFEMDIPYDKALPLVDSFGFFHNNPRVHETAEKKWRELKEEGLKGNTYAVFVDGHVQSVRSEDSYRLAKPK